MSRNILPISPTQDTLFTQTCAQLLAPQNMVLIFVDKKLLKGFINLSVFSLEACLHNNILRNAGMGSFQQPLSISPDTGILALENESKQAPTIIFSDLQ